MGKRRGSGYAPVPWRSLLSGWRSWPVLFGFVLLATVVLIASAAIVPHPAAGHWILDEEFEGPSLDTTVWNTCYWWGCTIASNDELQWYEPAQAKVADGQLQLTAEAMPGKTADGETFSYRSGMISSGPVERGAKPRCSFTYGTVEARLRVPASQGLWSALWMLPAFGDSRPEVDIVEVLGHDTRVSYQTLHPEDRDSRPFQGTNRGPDLADGWHIYRLDWLPRELRWYIDGDHVFTVKGDEVPDEPMYLIVNLAVGGRWPGPPDEFTQLPASLSVDYIRVRSWKN